MISFLSSTIHRLLPGSEKQDHPVLLHTTGDADTDNTLHRTKTTAQDHVRIGVFMDGGYFSEVSNYYMFRHPKAARIDLCGLQEFIRHQAADCQNDSPDHFAITEAHYFRGQFSAQAEMAAGKLGKRRGFEFALRNAGFELHLWPIAEIAGSPREKGVDVDFALEAFELAIDGAIDVAVIVAGDGDFIPLAQRLSRRGKRSIVLGWDFDYTYEYQGCRKRKQIHTNRDLRTAATYAIQMDQVIDDAVRRKDPLIQRLFLPRRPSTAA